ncbi:MAG: 6-phosphogluconate dehydrogenase [Saprospiraceae bacterium]|jgi:6-phosphogluconate dehydrogenase
MKDQTIDPTDTRVYFICGVSGCGKSTVGRALSKKIDLPFFDGDDFHPKENVAKMASGQPLDDKDRKRWLTAINKLISQSEDGLIVACSALKEKYRAQLSEDITKKIHWIFLNGDFDLIYNRMISRIDHFMGPNLLQSQFDILEIPNYAIECDIKYSVEKIVQNIRIQTLQMKKQLGLIGLGVMGKSLARNFADKGISLSLYNRFVKGSEDEIAKNFIESYPVLDTAEGHEDLQEFVQSLKTPRTVFLMISAGAAVDDTIEKLIPLLDKGDLIIDGGNSHYKLTQERNDKLSAHGIYFIGTGVSGGEEGALKGPSIMPGGEPEAYAICKDALEAIAAKDINGGSCCGYIGKGGAGHFVKMVHNGMEYAEMQFLAEIYGLLRYSAGYDTDFIANLFETWTKTDLNSYLLEITIEVLRKKEDDIHLVDIILDKAGNKGTGSWTTIAACELGVPVNTLTAALFARYQSAFKEERQSAEKLYGKQFNKREIDLTSLADAYKVARIINHHQGIQLIYAASESYNWNIDMPEVARIWTNGCIIRSELMEDLKVKLKEEPILLKHTTYVNIVNNGMESLRKVCSQAILSGSAIPCLNSALTYVETYINEQSTANIIQGQRDYFGAHRYQRKDDPIGPSHHTIWN